MKSSVSEKGQVTIPKPIRDKLGLRPGSVLEFQTKNGVLVGKKSDPAADPIAAVTGIHRRMPPWIVSATSAQPKGSTMMIERENER